MSALKRTSFILVIFIVAIASATLASMPQAFAQGTTSEKPPSGGPRRQLGTIIYAGLGGAVLGLSTLSFYGRPQDKLANIAIGFAVGVIGGTIAVTYNAATNPDDFYGTENQIRPGRDDLRERNLGPAPSMLALQNKKADDSSSAFSASFEILQF